MNGFVNVCRLHVMVSQGFRNLVRFVGSPLFQDFGTSLMQTEQGSCQALLLQ